MGVQKGSQLIEEWVRDIVRGLRESLLAGCRQN